MAFDAVNIDCSGNSRRPLCRRAEGKGRAASDKAGEARGRMASVWHCRPRQELTIRS